MQRLTSVLVCAGVLAACNEMPTAPAGLTPSFGKTPAPAAIVEWSFYSVLSDGATPTALRGDGYSFDKSSLAEPSVYRSDVCGVTTAVYSSGDVTHQIGGKSGCYRRLSFDLGGPSPLLLSTTGAVKEVVQLALGESRVQQVGFGISQSGCDRLHFQARVTRVAGSGGSNKGEWTVESVDSHIAQCMVYSGRTLMPTERYHVLPARYTINSR